MLEGKSKKQGKSSNFLKDKKFDSWYINNNSPIYDSRKGSNSWRWLNRQNMCNGSVFIS